MSKDNIIKLIQPRNLDDQLTEILLKEASIGHMLMFGVMTKWRNCIACHPLVLALQLPFCFEVRALSDRLVSSAPERPCDVVRGLDSFSAESDGEASDFLD